MLRKPVNLRSSVDGWDFKSVSSMKERIAMSDETDKIINEF